MKLENYKTFDFIVNAVNKSSPIKIEKTYHADGRHIGIKLKAKSAPISINESEFNYMNSIIVNHNLQNGFELSTGIGISTLGIATAFEKTGGHLITIDSYYEELTQIPTNIPVGNYTKIDIETIKLVSLSYQFVDFIITNLKLKPIVDMLIGWSPTDSIKAIEKRGIPLDFVFLDCPKNDEEFERDITSLKPFIGEKYVIFVHDTQCYTKKSFDLANKLFNKNMIQIYEYFLKTEYHSNRYFPLAIITNIDL